MSQNSQAIDRSVLARPRRFRWKLLRATLASALLVVAILSVVTQQMVNAALFKPEAYDGGTLSTASAAVQEHRYATSLGKQTAHFIPARNGQAATRLIVVFPGSNGSALHLAPHLTACPDDATAFLLVDFPGYGKNVGRPSRANVRENSLAAFRSFKDSSKVSKNARICVVGYALGATQALAVANEERYEVSQVVLLAPFTNLSDVAKQQCALAPAALFAPFHYDHDFDNHAALRSLYQRNPRRRLFETEPRRHVNIVCGSHDSTRPMAEKLARVSTSIRLHHVDGAAHGAAELLIWELFQ